MKFLRQDVVSVEEAKHVGTYDLAFIGQVALDERSRHSIELTKTTSRRQCTVGYDASKFLLHIDGKPVRVDCLEDVFRSYRAQSILLDATTLEFPEILYILSAYGMQKTRPRCGFFYVEPEGYRKRESSASVVPGNAFDLSESFKERTPLPIFRRLQQGNRVHLLAFLGFEGDRLLRVLAEDDGYFYEKVSVIFGVPPFQPSWDLHALMANSSLLERQNTSVHYCGANNPRAAYKLLEAVHQGVASSSTNRLAVAPFGTKPMALGAALYCLDNEIFSPIYDHPVRKNDRTFGVNRRHWYEVDLNR